MRASPKLRKFNKIGAMASSCMSPILIFQESTIKVRLAKEKIINKRIPKYILVNPMNLGNRFPLSSGRLFDVMHLTFVS